MLKDLFIIQLCSCAGSYPRSRPFCIRQQAAAFEIVPLRDNFFMNKCISETVGDLTFHCCLKMLSIAYGSSADACHAYTASSYPSCSSFFPIVSISISISTCQFTELPLSENSKSLLKPILFIFLCFLRSLW